MMRGMPAVPEKGQIGRPALRPIPIFVPYVLTSAAGRTRRWGGPWSLVGRLGLVQRDRRVPSHAVQASVAARSAEREIRYRILTSTCASER